MTNTTDSAGPDKAANGRKGPQNYEINPGSEKLISLAVASRLSWLSRSPGGKPIHRTTLWRWATKGVRGVKLPTCRQGYGVCTTEGALRWFIRRCTDELSKPRDRKGSSTASTSKAAAALDAAEI